MTFAKEYMDLGGVVYHYADADKLPRTKENALVLYLSMICRSWTFDRMTEKEKENCVNTFLRADYYGRVKGSFAARWEIMQNMYDAFLNALDYMSDPGDWRGNRSACSAF